MTLTISAETHNEPLDSRIPDRPPAHAHVTPGIAGVDDAWMPGVRIIWGRSVPISTYAALIRGHGRRAVLCQALADKWGALAVVVRTKKLAEAIVAEPAAGAGLSTWLSSGQTGLSSLFMARTLCKAPIGRPAEYAHPHDLDDFARCALFLRAVPLPERAPLSAMENTSPQWRALVARWVDIEALIVAGKAAEANDVIRQCVDRDAEGAS